MKFTQRSKAELDAMDFNTLAFEVGMHGRFEIFSEEPGSYDWFAPAGMPFTAVGWTYETGSSDHEALPPSEWFRWGGASPHEALLNLAYEIHGVA